ncbi:MAG: hypothetical protein MZW92_21200 [Comamonadaceae bacterium]|nr:hypothetical protein [Comamonadaceae bacterium]
MRPAGLCSLAVSHRLTPIVVRRPGAACSARSTSQCDAGQRPAPIDARTGPSAARRPHHVATARHAPRRLRQRHDPYSENRPSGSVQLTASEPCTKPSTGSTSKPFQLNPDPSFYFGSKQHRARQGLPRVRRLAQTRASSSSPARSAPARRRVLRALIDELDTAATSSPATW